MDNAIAAHVIVPSTLNVLIIGASMIVFGFLWRMASAFLAGSPWGEAGAVIL